MSGVSSCWTRTVLVDAHPHARVAVSRLVGTNQPVFPPPPPPLRVSTASSARGPGDAQRQPSRLPPLAVRRLVRLLQPLAR